MSLTFTTEAEFFAASQASKEAVWLYKLFQGLCFSVCVLVLQVENERAIRLIKDTKFHNRTKCIDFRYKIVRENFQSGKLDIEYFDSECQIAYLLTKLLPKFCFQKIRCLI